MQIVQNLINGQWRDSSDGKTAEQRNPAKLDEVTCLFAQSTRADAKAAIDAAAAAYPAWSPLTPAARADILTRALDVMRRRAPDIAQVLTLENGKTLRESAGEIDSAIKEMDWQIAEGRRLHGQIVPSSQAGVFSYVIRQPLGVVSVICPWNFPFNVPCRKVTPALMAGNTVVMKPASLTPRTGAMFAQVFAEAGLPRGVLNCITGPGSTVGDELVRNPAIKAISFTGSTPVGMDIHKAAAHTLARTQLEMGGKNAIVVLDDADLDAAADATVLAAYACAGQWCTSTSRAIVTAGVARAFEAKVLERVAKIRVGIGTDPQSTMGPVCGQAQLDGVLGYIRQGIDEGARLLAGGHRITRAGMENGCFIEPTVFTNVTPSMTIAKEEIFGPVLAIIEVRDFAEALTIANDSEFGLSSSVYTSSLTKAMAFASASEAGLVHVNLPTALKEPQLPFGGIKHSGVGLPEAGQSGIEFFTRHKAVYIKPMEKQ